MNYWIFKYDPEIFLIDRCFQESDHTVSWRVTRYLDQIREGDIAFIWRTGDQRGIRAVMKIDKCPYTLQERDVEPNPPIEDLRIPLIPGTTDWANGQFIQEFPLIKKAEIKQIPGLEDFFLFKKSTFQQATNFSVPFAEGKILYEYICKYKRLIQKLQPDQISPLNNLDQQPVQRASSAAILLQCGKCNRYIVSSDRDRHIREAHAGQLVEWKKTK